jgi:hypothetical protein
MEGTPPAVAGPEEGKASPLEYPEDQHPVMVEYPARDGSVLKGVFVFQALAVAHLHTVAMARLALIGGVPFSSLTLDEFQLFQALATLPVALVKYPEWFTPYGESKALGRDLYVGLHDEYLRWDAGLFRSVEAPGVGATEGPALRIAPLVGGGDGA